MVSRKVWLKKIRPGIVKENVKIKSSSTLQQLSDQIRSRKGTI
jgi:hypothetical protein